MGEGLDSYVLIGVEAAGRHPGEVFSIGVIAKDGTAKCGCILFICTALHHGGIYKIVLLILVIEILIFHALYIMYICKAVPTGRFCSI